MIHGIILHMKEEMGLCFLCTVLYANCNNCIMKYIYSIYRILLLLLYTLTHKPTVWYDRTSVPYEDTYHTYDMIRYKGPSTKEGYIIIIPPHLLLEWRRIAHGTASSTKVTACVPYHSVTCDMWHRYHLSFLSSYHICVFMLLCLLLLLYDLWLQYDDDKW